MTLARIRSVAAALVVFASCGGPDPGTTPASVENTVAVNASVPASTGSPTTMSTRSPVGVEPERVDGSTATYRYGPEPEQLLDVTHPDGVDAPDRPAIVYLASGGWMSPSRPTVPDFVTAQADRGWAVVAVDFRLAPDHVHPSPSADVDRAIRWIRRHGPSIGVDPDRLVLLGASSGGNLALIAAADPGRFADPVLPAELASVDPRPTAVVSVAGPGDLVAAYEQAGTWMHAAISGHLGCLETCELDLLGDASPIGYVAPSPPPALLLYGELDTFIPVEVQGDPLAAEWRAAGGEATVLVGAGAGHNLSFELGIDRTAFEAFLATIAAR